MQSCLGLGLTDGGDLERYQSEAGYFPRYIWGNSASMPVRMPVKRTLKVRVDCLVALRMCKSGGHHMVICFPLLLDGVTILLAGFIFQDLEVNVLAALFDADANFVE